MRFELDFQPASFLGRIDRNAQGKRPEVGFLFGVRDVEVDLRDEKTHALVRPTRAFAIRLLDNEVQLAEARRADSQGRYRVERAFQYTTLAKAPVALAAQTRVPVQISVRDTGIEIEIAGTRVHFATPKERSGFHGFVTRGAGLVALRNLKLTP